jgi:hypothetical protein
MRAQQGAALQILNSLVAFSHTAMVLMFMY